MEAELTRLESQIEQLVGLHEAAKSELREMRMRLAALESENRQLSGKLQFAVERFESVLAKLPEV
ncbi:MAG: hypothetical protein ACK4KV_18705 [Rhodocyclaceae bacterium]